MYPQENFDPTSTFASHHQSTQAGFEPQQSAERPSHSFIPQPQQTTDSPPSFDMHAVRPVIASTSAAVFAHGADASKPFKCTCCSRAFSKEGDLTKHWRNHSRPLPCLVCDAEYGGAAQNRDLNRHYWTHHAIWAKEHNIPEEKSQCPNCDYRGRNDNVKRHSEKCLFQNKAIWRI